MKLFIEGTTDTTNGDLRKGFVKLLEKNAQLKDNRPRIVMGNDTQQTINKFLNDADMTGCLLIDLDAPPSEREKKMTEYGLQQCAERVFFMIQEMEAWFFSQPEILEDFYGKDIIAKLPKKPATEISEPDKALQRLTEKTKKGKYHKVRHGEKLLEQLDVEKLRRDVKEVDRLIQKLSQ